LHFHYDVTQCHLNHFARNRNRSKQEALRGYPAFPICRQIDDYASNNPTAWLDVSSAGDDTVFFFQEISAITRR
jgi:hypothetical protein